MSDLDQVAEAVDQSIASFTNDPADSDYQKGYLSALREIRRIISEVQEQYARD